MATRLNAAPLLLLQIAMRRIEGITLVTVALCLMGAIVQGLVLRQIEKKTRAAEISLAEKQSGRLAPETDTLDTERYRAFRNRLADSGARDDLLKVVFSEATAAGLALPQGDYSLSSDTDGGFDKLQIILPVRGTYKQIRGFAKALLEKLPPLALDEINFRRESIKSTSVEVRLRLTLFLKDAP